MCMKSVNISSVFYDDDLSELGGRLQFGKVVNEVTTVEDFDGNNIVENLTIVSFASALSSDQDQQLVKKYELLWQFGTVINDVFTAKSIAKDIFDTEINKVEEIPEITCKSFTNQIFKFTLRNYKIEQPGNHYLKVYIREAGKNEKWQIQSMNTIFVK